MKRWTVIAWYWTDAGLIDVETMIDELDELQDLIERGPNWYALDRIEIRLSDKSLPMTIEGALAQ